MKENAINWDAVPDVITKDQLYRICHISKGSLSSKWLFAII